MKSFSSVTTLKVVVLAVLATVMFGGCAPGDTDEHQPTAAPTSASPKPERCKVDQAKNGNFTVIATFVELRKSTNGVSTVKLTGKPGSVINVGDASDGMNPGDWDNDANPGSHRVTFTKINAPQEAASVLHISGWTDASTLECVALR